jgi:hypothetical protein
VDSVYILTIWDSHSNDESHTYPNAPADTNVEPHFALHVYKGNRKVYAHEGAVIRNVYGNSPHCLVRLPVPQGESSHVLVVSLYDDKGAMPFTLTSYGVDPHTITKALDCPAVESGPTSDANKQVRDGLRESKQASE